MLRNLCVAFNAAVCGLPIIPGLAVCLKFIVLVCMNLLIVWESELLDESSPVSNFFGRALMDWTRISASQGSCLRERFGAIPLNEDSKIVDYLRILRVE